MIRRCRSHLKRVAIQQSIESNEVDVQWMRSLSGEWLLHRESVMEIPMFDPADFLPGSPEELIAWGLGLDVDDLPGWGTEVDTSDLRIFTI